MSTEPLIKVDWKPLDGPLEQMKAGLDELERSKNEWGAEERPPTVVAQLGRRRADLARVATEQGESLRAARQCLKHRRDEAVTRQREARVELEDLRWESRGLLARILLVAWRWIAWPFRD